MIYDQISLVSLHQYFSGINKVLDVQHLEKNTFLCLLVPLGVFFHIWEHNYYQIFRFSDGSQFKVFSI